MGKLDRFWNVRLMLSTWPDIGDFKNRMDARFTRVGMFSTHPKFGTNVEDAQTRLLEFLDEAIEPGNNIETLIMVDMYCPELASLGIAIAQAYPTMEITFMGTEKLKITDETPREELVAFEFVKDWVIECSENADERFKVFYENDKTSRLVKFDYEFDTSLFKEVSLDAIRGQHKLN